MLSSGTTGQRCEPGMKRVAPLSERNSSTMKMNPRSGQSADSRLTSTCSFWFGIAGRNVREWSDLSLKGWAMTRQQASRSGRNTSIAECGGSCQRDTPSGRTA